MSALADKVQKQEVPIRSAYKGLSQVFTELFLDSESHQKSQTVTPNKGVLHDSEEEEHT